MDPVTLAAAGFSAAGKLMGGIMANEAARARGRALDDQARQALGEAGVASMVGAEQDERLMARAATVAATQGGGGIGASRVLADLERQSAFKARNTIYRGRAEARNARYEANLSRTEGRHALIGSAIEATGSMLNTFAQAAEAKRGASGGGRG